MNLVSRHPLLTQVRQAYPNRCLVEPINELEQTNRERGLARARIAEPEGQVAEDRKRQDDGVGVAFTTWTKAMSTTIPTFLTSWH